MAKAYGYLGKKKESYKSSQVEKIHNPSLNIYILLVCQLVMSSWDIRGFTLEANIDKLDEKNKCSSSLDTEPCTGDQLADSEKVVGGLEKSSEADICSVF